MLGEYCGREGEGHGQNRVAFGTVRADTVLAKVRALLGEREREPVFVIGILGGH